MTPTLERPFEREESTTSFGSVVDICTFVDDLDASAAGELAIERGGQRIGAVYIEGGRICWAAAKGMARRLTELLVVRTGDVVSMERHFRACQDGHVPLGEHLVGRGIVSADDLRGALLQHSAESIVHLCRESSRGLWRPRDVSRYNARFSFGSAEILIRTVSLGLRSDCEGGRAEAELDRCFGDTDWGAAFLRTEASAVPEPIAVRGAWPRSATQLRRIGKWAASAIDLASTHEGDSPLIAITMPPTTTRTPGRGAVLVAFATDLPSPILFVGETSLHGPARILNRRAQLRRDRG